MASQQFHIGDILSVTTGRFVGPETIQGLYDLLAFLVGPFNSHEIRSALVAGRSALLQQYPQLDDVTADGVRLHNHSNWLSAASERFGERLPVTSRTLN